MLFASKKSLYIVAVVSALIIYLVLCSSIIHINMPCACVRCMNQNNDRWFTQIYRPSIEPLLTKRNCNLKNNIFLWWQSLQYKLSRDVYNKAVKQLFKVFPNKQRYADAGPGRCRTCAVVGNSGNLIRSRYGPLIDAHDFIIRMNRGPIHGFEQDVGTKTTHRVIYPESAVDLDNSTHLVLFPFKTADIQWLISAFTTKHMTKTYKPVRSTIQAEKEKVMVLNPAFMKYVHESWLGKHGQYPSTGFLSIVLALHICDEVDLFGFGADKEGNWHHYFERTPVNTRTGKHSGQFEYDAVSRLLERGKVQIFRGW